MAGRDSEYDRPILLACGGCAARWTALTAAHCPTCHATFAGATSGFDAHRVNGACEPPVSVGLREDRGYWLLDGERPPGRVLYPGSDAMGASSTPPPAATAGAGAASGPGADAQAAPRRPTPGAGRGGGSGGGGKATTGPRRRRPAGRAPPASGTIEQP